MTGVLTRLFMVLGLFLAGCSMDAGAGGAPSGGGGYGGGGMSSY